MPKFLKSPIFWVVVILLCIGFYFYSSSKKKTAATVTPAQTTTPAGYSAISTWSAPTEADILGLSGAGPVVVDQARPISEMNTWSTSGSMGSGGLGA